MALKNTRLLSNPSAAPYVFEGDPAVCSTWIGWATAKLQHMIKSPGSLSCTFNPVSDVWIRIDTKPNRIFIKAGSKMYVLWQDGGTRRIKKDGSTSRMNNYTSEVNAGYTKYWHNLKKTEALAYGDDGICWKGDKYIIKPSSPYTDEFSAMFIDGQLLAIYKQLDATSGPYKYVIKEATLVKPTEFTGGSISLGSTLYEFSDMGIILAKPSGDDKVWTISRDGPNNGVPPSGINCFIKCFTISITQRDPLLLNVAESPPLTVDCNDTLIYNPREDKTVIVDPPFPSPEGFVKPEYLLGSYTPHTKTEGAIYSGTHVVKNKISGVAAIGDDLFVAYNEENNSYNQDYTLKTHYRAFYGESSLIPGLWVWQINYTYVEDSTDYTITFNNSCKIVKYTNSNGSLSESEIYTKTASDTLEYTWKAGIDADGNQVAATPYSVSYITPTIIEFEPSQIIAHRNLNTKTENYTPSTGRIVDIKNENFLDIGISIISDFPYTIVYASVSLNTLQKQLGYDPYAGYPNPGEDQDIIESNSNSTSLYTSQGYLSASDGEISAMQLFMAKQVLGEFTTVSSWWERVVFYKGSLVFRADDQKQVQAVTIGVL